MSRRVLLTLGAAGALAACGRENRTGANGTSPETATPCGNRSCRCCRTRAGSTPPGGAGAKIETFTDNFEKDLRHWRIPYGAGTTTWVGGRLQMQITQSASAGGEGYTGITSAGTWDLTESSCFIRLYPPTAPSHGDQTAFRTLGPAAASTR